MFPIQKHSLDGLGRGMGIHDFVNDFIAVCDNHTANGRAKSFAFIFYNLHNSAIRKAINASPGFHRLDDLTGNNLTLFYMHNDAADAYNQSFNETFLKALNVEEQTTLPCMVVFRTYGDVIEDIMIFSVDPNCWDPTLIVAELEDYLKSAMDVYSEQGDISALIALIGGIKAAGKLIGVNEFLKKLVTSSGLPF